MDLYAAGVILYECLTGRLPYDGNNYHQLLQAILAGDHPRARTLRPAVPAELDTVVERSLGADPSTRYGSAQELLRELVPFGAIEPAPSTDPGFAAADTQPVRVTRPETAPLDVSEVPTPERPAPTPRDRVGLPALSPHPERRTSGRRTPRGLAPSPRALTGPARPFSARSADWPDENERPAAMREVERPYQRARGAGGGGRVKASLVLPVLERLRSEGTLERVLERLEAHRSQPFRGVILPVAWLPLGAFAELLAAAEDELGEGTLERLGRAAADRELPKALRRFMEGTSPSAAVEHIPRLFRAYHDAGSATLRRIASGDYTVTLNGLSSVARAHGAMLSVFFRCLLELAGAQGARADDLPRAGPRSDPHRPALAVSVSAGASRAGSRRAPGCGRSRSRRR